MTEDPLSDQDISSLIIAGEVFFEDRRYRLNITFENDPISREGIVFRESKKIARALGLKPVPPGAFLELDSERIKIVPTPDWGGIRIGVYSSLTGERVSSTAIVPSGSRWKIDDIIEGFIDDTDEFIRFYFGEVDDFREKLLDFDEALEEIRSMLRRMKKGFPLR